MTTLLKEAQQDKTHGELVRLVQAGTLRGKKRPTVLDRLKAMVRRRKMRKPR